tara:strand:+ start:394 stop:828 length:435 start_codon:yes stop_codon:yes gene_type:complete
MHEHTTKKHHQVDIIDTQKKEKKKGLTWISRGFRPSVIHNSFVLINSIVKLSKTDERVANVAHNFVSQFFGRVWYLIQCHTIVFDGIHIFFLFIIYVSHIYTKSTSLWILFIFHNDTVRLKCLAVHLGFVLTARQIETHRVRQV